MNAGPQPDELRLSGKHWTTKRVIAAHYQIGRRTVTKLMGKRILPYRKCRNLVRFDINECDLALEYFKVPVLHQQRTVLNAHQTNRKWRTKRQIAAHFQISERTVTAWMRRRVLPYMKIGQLVRLDLAECDCAFEHLKHESVLSRSLRL